MILRRKRVKRARYNGAPFYIDANETIGGRRIAFHEFPYSEIPATEDLGRKAKQWGIAGFVLGALYKEDAERLKTALDKEGVGNLDHPYLGGSKKVRCLHYRVVEMSREYGLIQFFMTFCEAGEIPKFAVSTGPNLISSFDKVLRTIQVASTSVSGIADTIDGFSESIEDRLAPIIGFRQSLGDLMTALANLKEVAREITTEPGALFYAFKNAIDFLVGSPLAALTVINAMDAAIEPFLEKRVSSQVLSQALGCTLLIQMSEVAVGRRIERIQDREKAQAIVITRCDQWVQELTHAILVDVVQDVKVRTFKPLQQKPVEKRVTVVQANTNSILLTHELYRSVERESELTQLNSFPHPGFIAKGTEIEVAS